MVTFSQNPVPTHSGHGDGRFLLHMLAQRMRGTPNEVVGGPGEQVIAQAPATGMPRQLVDPMMFQSEQYAEDPMANAEINPLAPATGGNLSTPTQRTPSSAMQPAQGVSNIPQARGVSNMPMARPEMQGPMPQQAMQGRAPTPDVAQMQMQVLLQNMHDQLGNSASATPMDSIDGVPGGMPAQQDEGGFPWGKVAAGAGGIAALIAAILSGRGRSAPGMDMRNRGVTPYEPGMTGEIMGNPQIAPPSRPGMSPSQAMLETDILSATPNTLGRSDANLPATRPTDAPVAQGRPTTVNPDVMQGSPRPTGAIANNSIRYRGQVYSIDAQGNVLDRNGDVVRGMTADTVKRMAQGG